MSTSSILILGHPEPSQTDFGADHFDSEAEALSALKKHLYAVLVVSADGEAGFVDFLKAAKTTNPDMQTILVGSQLAPDMVQQAINETGLFKILPRFEPQTLQTSVREALEEYELIKQNEAFLALTKEQNFKLQQLSGLLEEKVKAREAFLSDARENLNKVTKRTEALNRALVTIQKSISKSSMETQLNQTLHSALGTLWVKVVLQTEDQVEFILLQDRETHVLSVPLIQQGVLLGHIYFARGKSNPFSSDEDDFLLQISDAVAIAIDRLMVLEKAEAIKQEWDSTFDSITSPVALLNQTYSILRANKAYAQRANLPLDKVAGQKCFAVLFGRQRPCDSCKLGENFELGEVVCRDKTQAFYSVHSHLVDVTTGTKTFALFYRDTSQEHRFQRQILEASKMAEIGTIGSSIAHEINNPLGGMIAFLQIVKSEMKKDDSLFQDVLEMETAALRCKSIVENLLAFTRQSGSAELKPVRFGDIFRLVVNLIELQTRSIGIRLEKQIENADSKINADINQIVQVLVNVMQNSCEALAEKLENSPRLRSTFEPTIVLKTRSEKQNDLVIEIFDNGIGVRDTDLSRVFNPFFTTKDNTKNPGLGLSVGYQIIKEHQGQMEISSVHGESTTVVIRLPLVKVSGPQSKF